MGQLHQSTPPPWPPSQWKAQGVKTEPDWTDFYAPEGKAFDSTARAVSVDNQIVAAVNVSSAAQYMSNARMAELTRTVTDVANAISRDLGWSPKP